MQQRTPISCSRQHQLLWSALLRSDTSPSDIREGLGMPDDKSNNQLQTDRIVRCVQSTCLLGWKSLASDYSAFRRQKKSFGSALLFCVTILSDTALHFASAKTSGHGWIQNPLCYAFPRGRTKQNVHSGGNIRGKASRH
uniref:Uncharacterized protein n=2 Tax=Triticum urartu TaxID=4572 RepID=A0A8R7NZ51_TRIUA